MNKVYSTEKVVRAVDMSQYGIVDTVVLTEHCVFNEMKREYAIEPDTVWCNGLGKKYLHKMLRKHLLKEGKFFNNNLQLAQRNSVRWIDFCHKCVIFVTLNSYLYQQPIYLLDEESYAKSIEKAGCKGTSGVK